MLIALTPEQEVWLRAQVARGPFASIEEAARRLLDECIAERELEEDDLGWAKPKMAVVPAFCGDDRCRVTSAAAAAGRSAPSARR
jgi:Arc/MetJ-type ribon-helix-helix transcriptional regulator